jgi:hypothetical protein
MEKNSESDKVFETRKIYLKYGEERKILLQESFWCHAIHDVCLEVLDDAVHVVAGLLVGTLEIFLSWLNNMRE